MFSWLPMTMHVEYKVLCYLCNKLDKLYISIKNFSGGCDYVV